MKEPQADVSKLIKKIRQIAGITQVELASELGITPTSVYRYEAGTSKPGNSVLRGLLAYAAERPDLTEERSVLDQVIDQRNRSIGEDRARYDAYFTASNSPMRLALQRPFLNVSFLASLSESEHDLLEAVLAVCRGRDAAAKRMLEALVMPLLQRAAPESPTPSTDK